MHKQCRNDIGSKGMWVHFCNHWKFISLFVAYQKHSNARSHQFDIHIRILTINLITPLHLFLNTLASF